MSYPDILLPLSTYCRIEKDLSTYYLIRHFVDKGVSSDILDINGKLKNGIIGQSNTLPDLSTSLYGIFKHYHVKYSLLNQFYNENWDFSNSIENILVETVDFTLNTNRNYYIVKISDLHNQSIKDDVGNIFAVCKGNHTPTNGNYWHFSINWFITSEGKYWHQDIENISITKNLKRTMRNLIKEYSIIGTPLDVNCESISYLNTIEIE